MTNKLINAIELSEFDWLRSFKYLPKARIYESDKLNYIITDRPYRTINGVFGAKLNQKDIASTIEDITTAFSVNKLPFRWIVGPNSQPRDLGQHLVEKGFEMDEILEGMFLKLDQFRHKYKCPEGLEIQEIKNLDLLNDGLRIFTDCFGFPKFALDAPFIAYASVGLGGTNGWTHYIGLHKGDAVAFCSRLSYEDTIAVHNVSVTPSYRRKGAATFIVAEVLESSLLENHRMAVLHATREGRPVYELMGFSTCCKLEFYRFSIE